MIAVRASSRARRVVTDGQLRLSPGSKAMIRFRGPPTLKPTPRTSPARSSSTPARCATAPIMLGIPLLGVPWPPAATGERPAQRGLPGHHGARQPARAPVPDRWRRRSRRRSRTAVLSHRRPRGNDFEQPSAPLTLPSSSRWIAASTRRARMLQSALAQTLRSLPTGHPAARRIRSRILPTHRSSCSRSRPSCRSPSSTSTARPIWRSGSRRGGRRGPGQRLRFAEVRGPHPARSAGFSRRRDRGQRRDRIER